MTPPPPPPPPLPVILAAVESWAARLEEAMAEPDAAEQAKLLEHLRNNLRNAVVILKWYQGGGC